MSFRLALGGLEHETNTYAVETFGPTTLDAFLVGRGDEITANLRGTRTYLGGMIDTAERLGAEPVPLLMAFATPSGTIAAGAYAALKDELVERLRAAGPIDAVALDLHGAGVAEGVDDLEADLVRAVRGVVGPAVPIGATLDLHGNVSDAMAEALDLALGVHLYPHTDMYERGGELVELLDRVLRGELCPRTHVEHVPMLVPTTTTQVPPASEVNELCREIEARPGIVDCTFFHGFPYTDVPLVGAHVVVTAHDDHALAREAAREVAAAVWTRREEFRSGGHTPGEAVRRALEAGDGPVVVNDTSDNPDGGAPGDGTHLLRALLDAGVDDACFAYLADPDAVAVAVDAGVGSTVELALGGRHGLLHGAPLAVTAQVRTITDGRFELRGEMFGGVTVDIGPTVLLRIGGVDVVVSSKRGQTFDPEVFLLHGIDIRRYRIVALKGSQHFRAAFDPIATAIVTADAPGFTTLHPEQFPRCHAPGPLWPLDPDAEYRP